VDSEIIFTVKFKLYFFTQINAVDISITLHIFAFLINYFYNICVFIVD
jgi:hypothetical protein